MGALSRLDAVNEMLLQSGEALVSDLDGQSGVDTSIAEHILDQKITEFAMRGIAQNMAVRKFTPDETGRVLLPTNTLSARVVDYTGVADSDAAELVQSLGDNLQIYGLSGDTTPYVFNVGTGTDIFDSDVECTIKLVFDISFENMDVSIQKAVIYTAARSYQMLSQGDPAADQYLSQMESYYEGKAKGWDNTSKNRNVLDSNTALRAVLRGTRGSYGVDPNWRRYGRRY